MEENEEPTCDSCGAPLDDEPGMTLGDFPKVGEIFTVHCSVTPSDELGLCVISHPDSGERRIVVECSEVMEDEAEAVYGALATGIMHGKVLLTAQTARMFAARLLDAADLADDIPVAVATDFDKELGRLLNGDV